MNNGKTLTAVAGLAGLLSLIRCAGGDTAGDNAIQRYAGLDSSTAYAGMEACRSCHADIYATFSHTGMGLSFDTASLAKSAAGPGPHGPVCDSALNYYYLPYWEGDSMRILEYRLAGGDTVHRRVQTVHYIVGSGQHTNSHMYAVNGYLHQAPLTYYTQSGRWDLPPGFEAGGNSRFSRIIGLECITCHNAYPDMVPGSENKYRSVKKGIDCERCHGPGQRHVDEKRAGRVVDITRETDYTIVNPAKLPPDLQFDVCQRCHIQGNAVLDDGKSFFDFRPGMPLRDVMRVYMPVWKGRPDEHIMASHAERLKQSRCYLATAALPGRGRPDRTLTCITCHNPHVSVRQTGTGHFNKACTGCHTGPHGGCTAGGEALAAASFNCVQCHMPASGTTDIPHVRVTDHLIRKPLRPGQIDSIRTFAGIACINDPDPPGESKGRAFINYFEKFGFDRFVLDSARKYFPDNTDDDVSVNFDPLVHIAFLEKVPQRIAGYVERIHADPGAYGTVSWSNRDAWTCYRIGQAYEAMDRIAEAVPWYARAVALAPFNLDIQAVYGSALAAGGRAGEARAVFAGILSEFPDYPRALSNLGYLDMVLSGDTAGARMRYQRAIALDPDYLAARYNLAGLYIYRNEGALALAVLRGILREHPGERQAADLMRSLAESP